MLADSCGATQLKEGLSVSSVGAGPALLALIEYSGPGEMTKNCCKDFSPIVNTFIFMFIHFFLKQIPVHKCFHAHYTQCIVHYNSIITRNKVIFLLQNMETS